MSSGSDVDTDDLHTLTINEHYSKALSYKRETEELKNESDGPSSGTEASESSEDSDGVELTPAIDAAIFRTLVRIRAKDEAIYDGDRQVFEEEESKTKDRAPLVKKKRNAKSKPLTVRQAALSAILEDGQESPRSLSPHSPTHVEQQRHLQSEIRAAFHGAVESLNEGDNVGGDDFFIPRSSAHDEFREEEEEYKAFLEREVGRNLHELVSVDSPEMEGDSSAGTEEKRKQKKKTREEHCNEKKYKEKEDHDFLMNYIFDRGWIDHKKQRIPTYSEVVDSSQLIEPGKSKSTTNDDKEPVEFGKDGHPGSEEALDLSDEDSFDDLADAFEQSYNFRFEEPGGSVIPSHPRHVPSARREPTTRKDGRQRRKERKEIEQKELLGKRKEEIRREREEIERQVAQELAEEHGEMEPVIRKKKGKDNVDSKTGPIPKEEKRKKAKKRKQDDWSGEDGVDVDIMDADVHEECDGLDDEWNDTEEMRKKKVDQYMDEVVSRLGFNDITADIPTRFHYIQTTPKDYGLTPAEILLATDSELNSYVGFKKLAPYRRGGKGKSWDPTRNERLKEFRSKLWARVSDDGRTWSTSGGEQQAGGTESKKRRLGRKERSKMKAAADVG